MKTVDVQTMQALDRRTIEELGLPGILLMERAALGLENAILNYFPQNLARVLIVAGSGNNGADGLALARLLHLRQIAVTVAWQGQKEKCSPEHQQHWSINQKLGIPQVIFADLEDFEPLIARASLVVDGIFGVGLSRPIIGLWQAVIQRINHCDAPTVAIDIPSGIEGNTGQVLGAAIQAELTVTFAYPKWGLLMDNALQAVGKLEVVDIGIPPRYAKDEPGEVLSLSQIAAWLPGPRPRAAHKGHYGKLAIIAGSLGMSGAAVFAAQAALYAGVGILYLCVPESIQNQVAAQLPEALVMPYSEQNPLPVLQKILAQANALLLGPGLGQAECWQENFAALLNGCVLPLVLDADGLNLWAQNPQRFETPTLITPHMGELARILRCSTQEIQGDRIGFARRTANDFNCTHVLKGANTIIAQADGRFWINPTGNPVLSRGGSGDVLAGLIAGLLAQGLAPERAATIAVYWHGMAADALANQKNEVTITVGELISYLPPTYSKILKSSLN